MPSGTDWEAHSAALISWFQDHQRDLPWRHTRDPYSILVSELMLQQTTVAAVLSARRFERFLERFPTWESLALAREEDVLHEWAGLGYYRRARSLRAAAIQVMDLHSGELPADLDAILALLGVGVYTGGAVASFAFGIPTPLVDTNVARVLARLLGVDSPLADPSTQKALWDRARHILPGNGETARLHNGALMELGALICRPRDPLCPGCPLKHFCYAYRTDQTALIPPPRAPVTKISRLMTALALVRTDGCILLRRAPAGEWHAGLLTLPSILQPQEQTVHLSFEQFPYRPKGARPQGVPIDSRFVVTRHQVKMRTWRSALPASQRSTIFSTQAGDEFVWQAPGREQPDQFQWVPLELAPAVGLGSPYRKVVSLLQSPEMADLFSP